MALDINNNRSSAPAAQGQARANWQADAFLNAWVDLPGGKSIKLGALTYKLSKKVEAQLIEMLSQPGAVDNLKHYIRFDFQLANQASEGNMFAFLAAPAPTAPSAETEAPFEMPAQA